MTIQFSIVIPTFNDLKQLKSQLESVGRQTVPCEVVVVDDGSPDGIGQYVRRLNPELVYYRHAIPLGYAESANAGVELARGNWIVLLNQSHRLQSDYLERLSEALDRYPTAAIAACQTRPPQHYFPDVQVVCVPQEDVHYQMLCESLGTFQANPAAFRRDAFLRSGGWRPGSSYMAQAIDAWVRIAQCGDLLSIDLPASDPENIAQPSPTPSPSQNPWGDLEIQYEMSVRVAKKHDRWLANSPTVQMIRKFHWNWMGLKNSLFPGLEGVLPGVSLERGISHAPIKMGTRASSYSSLPKVFSAMALPKQVSQLTRT